MKLLTALFPGAIALLITASGFAQGEIILESVGEGTTPPPGFKIVEGNWIPSESKSKAPGLKATKSLFNTADAVAGSVRFTPTINAAGKYEVFVTYPESGNAVGVIYKVHSADGDKEIVQDQHGRAASAPAPANAWNSLGTFSFKAGTDGYIEIHDPKTGKRPNEKEPNARVYADAVRLAPPGTTSNVTASARSTVVPGMPALAPPGTPATSTSGMPSLGSPSAPGVPPLPTTADLPALGAATSTPPSLPALSAAVTPAGSAAGMPSLGAATGAPSTGLPSLGAATTPAASGSGLPSLGAASSTPSAPGLPSLGSTASTPSPSTGLPTLGAATGSTAPGLPSLGAAETPAASTGLPTLGAATSTPAGSALPGMPPALGSAEPPALGALPTPTSATAIPTFGSPTGAPAGAATTEGGLQWMHDFGSAQATARNLKKNILVFFTAPGNRTVQRYESEFFSNAAVRASMDNFVLMRVVFPENTKLGYSMGIFGAGMIAITDAGGSKLGDITQIPPTPEDLAKRLGELK